MENARKCINVAAHNKIGKEEKKKGRGGIANYRIWETQEREKISLKDQNSKTDKHKTYGIKKWEYQWKRKRNKNKYQWTTLETY